MVMSFKRHFATEKRSLRYCIQIYPKRKRYIEKIINRIRCLCKLDVGMRILELGSAQGMSVMACSQMGYKVIGLEPYEYAIKVSQQLFKNIIDLNIVRGFAEDPPFKNNLFDLVIALSVVEHVKDVKKVFEETYRVLKPNGLFYFSAASSLCPTQHEIRFFPFFSWYPEKIKRKIMNWSIRYCPSLIGYTDTPAINWFTPWGASKLLKTTGFKKIYDRWDLLLLLESNKFKKMLLKIIVSGKITRLFANLLFSGCEYVAVK